MIIVENDCSARGRVVEDSYRQGAVQQKQSALLVFWQDAMITIRIPALWRATVGAKQVDVEAADVQAALDALIVRCPRLAGQLFDQAGRLHNGLNVFVNRESIRYRGNVSAKLHDGDEIYIVPMISGG